VIYYAYQRYEREEWKSKRGDFVEWLVGIALGTSLRAVLLYV